MDVKMIFTAPYGLHTITQHTTYPMLDVDASHGRAQWMDASADISALVP